LPKANYMIPQINTSNIFSGCMIDHAPRGRNRNRYIAMQRWISTNYGDYRNQDVSLFEPADFSVDVGELPDDVIARIQRVCSKLRKTDKPYAK